MSDSITTDHESIQDSPLLRYLYKDSISTDPRQIIEYRVGFYPKRFRFFYQINPKCKTQQVQKSE